MATRPRLGYQQVQLFAAEAKRAEKVLKRGDCNLAQQYLDSADHYLTQLSNSTKHGDVSPQTLRTMDRVVRRIQSSIDRCETPRREPSGSRRGRR